MASQTMELSMEIKLVPLKSRLNQHRNFEYIPTEDPVKQSIQFYKPFVRSVKGKYGEQSKEVIAFRNWYRACKQHRITVREFELRIKWLLKSQRELFLMLHHTILPYLYPLASENEVDRANQFIQRVKSAFPNNRDYSASDCISILWFQDGLSTLEQMTDEVLQVLGNRDDLIEAYMDFVPQAKNFRTRA